MPRPLLKSAALIATWAVRGCASTLSVSDEQPGAKAGETAIRKLLVSLRRDGARVVCDVPYLQRVLGAQLVTEESGAAPGGSGVQMYSAPRSSMGLERGTYKRFDGVHRSGCHIRLFIERGAFCDVYSPGYQSAVGSPLRLQPPHPVPKPPTWFRHEFNRAGSREPDVVWLPVPFNEDCVSEISIEAYAPLTGVRP